jgi:integrase
MNKIPKYRNKSVKQILAANPKETLSDTSVNKYMRRISAMFNWGVDRDLVAKNFFRRKPIQESKKANQKRDMLSTGDLAALFNPDIFKAEADQPFKFWSPLIALYTGARQNEIAQMDGKDIVQIHGVWCFRFITAKQKKYTERVVPIHSKLIELGIVDYAIRQSSKLFVDLHDRRDGHGQDVSKWYNRYRRKCGICDVRNKDFHSFRHTFSTALFRAGVNPTIIAELDGHVAGGGKRRTTTEEVYIKPSEVMVLKEAVEMLDYGDVVDRLRVAGGWRGSDVDGNQ